jgi:hypothetical protein
VCIESTSKRQVVWTQHRGQCRQRFFTYMSEQLSPYQAIECRRYEWQSVLLLRAVTHITADINESSTITGLDRPLGLLEVEAPRISGPSPPEGSRVVNPKHRPPLPPQEIAPILTFVISWFDTRAIVRPGIYVNEKFQWRHLESKPRPAGL